MGNPSAIGTTTERPKSVTAESFSQMIRDIQDNLTTIEKRLDQVFGAKAKDSKEKLKPCSDLPFEILKDQVQAILERVYDIRERIESSL